MRRGYWWCQDAETAQKHFPGLPSYPHRIDGIDCSQVVVLSSQWNVMWVPWLQRGKGRKKSSHVSWLSFPLLNVTVLCQNL